MLPAWRQVQDEMLVVHRCVCSSVAPHVRYNVKLDPRSAGAVVVLSANGSTYSGFNASPSMSFALGLMYLSDPDLVCSITEHLIRQVRRNVVFSDVSTPKLSVSAWYQERGAGVENGGTTGRRLYTSLGHTKRGRFVPHMV
jgi:hypothetical protein